MVVVTVHRMLEHEIPEELKLIMAESGCDGCGRDAFGRIEISRYGAGGQAEYFAVSDRMIAAAKEQMETGDPAAEGVLNAAEDIGRQPRVSTSKERAKAPRPKR